MSFATFTQLFAHTTALELTLLLVLAFVAGMVFMFAIGWGAEHLWPLDPPDVYAPPGHGLDMDAIYSNPRLRFADPAPKADAHFKTKITSTTTKRDAGNDVNAGV